MDSAQRAQALREIAEEKEKRETIYSDAITTLEEAETTLYHLLTVTFPDLEKVSGEVGCETEPDCFESSGELWGHLTENQDHEECVEAIRKARVGLDELRRFVLDAIDV